MFLFVYTYRNQETYGYKKMKQFIEHLFKPGFLQRASLEERQQENSEYQEECEPSERQQGHIDAGMCESDFY